MIKAGDSETLSKIFHKDCERHITKTKYSHPPLEGENSREISHQVLLFVLSHKNRSVMGTMFQVMKFQNYTCLESKYWIL
jgi:hypothetical protein